MTYITLEEFKSILGTTNAANFTDSQLNAIIATNNARINRELNVKVNREFVRYINVIKQNDQDGSNKTFYVQNWLGKYLGDANNDGTVTTEDIRVFSIETDGTETELTVTSIDPDNNSFTLSTAPTADVTLVVNYQYSFYDMSTPDQSVKDLASYLCLKDAFFDLEIDLIGTSAKMGNLSVAGLGQNTKTHKYDAKAKELLSEMKRFSTSKRKPVMFNQATRRRYRREHYLSNPNLVGDKIRDYTLPFGRTYGDDMYLEGYYGN